MNRYFVFRFLHDDKDYRINTDYLTESGSWSPNKADALLMPEDAADDLAYLHTDDLYVAGVGTDI